MLMLIRNHGLWRGLYSLARELRANPSELLSAARSIKNWQLPLMVAMVPAIGWFSAFLLPAIIKNLFLSPYYRSGLLGTVLTHAAVIDGLLGAMVAIYVWLLGLSYIARPGIHRKVGPPHLYLPDTLRSADCDHLAVNIYWYYRIKTAALFAALYPWVFLIVGTVSVPTGSSSGDNSSGTFSFVIGVGIAIAIMVPCLGPPMAIAHLIERRMISAQVGAETCSLLESIKERKLDKQTTSSALIVDPLGQFRRHLTSIAEHLADAARELDARQVRGFSPHPISTLLRAVSRSIRQFLKSEQSLWGSIPAELVDTLTMTVALLTAPRDQDIYHSLGEKVSAFGKDGEPAVELMDKPPGRLAILASRTVTSVPRIGLVITSIAGIAVILTAIILTLLHKMNVHELLSYLQ